MKQTQQIKLISKNFDKLDLEIFIVEKGLTKELLKTKEDELKR